MIESPINRQALAVHCYRHRISGNISFMFVLKIGYRECLNLEMKTIFYFLTRPETQVNLSGQPSLAAAASLTLCGFQGRVWTWADSRAHANLEDTTPIKIISFPVSRPHRQGSRSDHWATNGNASLLAGDQWASSRAPSPGSLTSRGPVTSEDLGRNDEEQDFASSGQSLVLSLVR